MPGRYRKSKRADKDIGGILEYSYRNFGLVQAKRYKASLDSIFQMLAENPDAGFSCDEIEVGYRRFRIEKHLIFYRVRKKDIFIVRVTARQHGY